MTDFYLSTATLPTFGQRLALRALHLIGWRVAFRLLPGPRGVVIVYPHTSNWDFIVGVLAKWAIGIRFRWVGKPSLFTGICGATLGPAFRAWGGEPIERDSSTGAIKRLAERIRAADEYWLAITPEGTRKYRDSWRSGFYYIALEAGVPLGIARFDYGRKEVRFTDYLTMSGDKDADLAAIRAAFADCRGCHPEDAAPIDFKSRQEGEEGKREEGKAAAGAPPAADARASAQH